MEDHGFHILQPWYANVHGLVDRLGIEDNFVDCPNYYQLLAGEFPRLRNFRAVFNLRDIIADVRSGVTPVPDRILFYYLLVDLLSQRYPNRRRRDVAMRDFLASRWYLTTTTARELEHFILTASAWDFDRASAATFRAGIETATRFRRHVRMPTASLEEAMIGPFRQRLEAVGVEVVTGCKLVALAVEADGAVQDDGAAGLTLTFRRDGQVETVPAAQVVLAIPHDRLAALGTAVCDLFVPAGGVPKLRSRPLGALHLHLRRSLPELPGEHVRLVGSEYAISLIDIAKLWREEEGSVLNCVIGGVGALRGLPEEEAVRLLVDELIRYIPSLRREEIKHVHYQPHFQEPFFMADSDSWRFRPATSTRLANLHLAGDFVDLASGAVAMEAAVVSGLLAAESVRRSVATGAPPVGVLTPGQVRPSLALIGKLALAPLAAVARLAARETATTEAGSRRVEAP